MPCAEYFPVRDQAPQAASEAPRDGPAGDADQDDAAAPGEDADEEAPPAATPAAVVPPDTPDADSVTIRALGKIPTFVGPDMQTYDLDEGDLATVPAGIADLLTRRGKAAIVEA